MAITFQLRIVNPELSKTISIAEKIQQVKHRDSQSFEDFGVIAAWKLRLKTALIIDAVTLFYEIVHELLSSKVVMLSTQPVYCNNSDNWHNGYTIINYMKRVSQLIEK